MAMIPKPRIVEVHTTSPNGGYYEVNGNTLEGSYGGKIDALDASLSLAIDGVSSSATIRLPQGVRVDGRTYIELFTIQGSAGIFRTRSPQIGYGGNSTQLQLEHAINELGDFIITDKIQTKTTLKKAVKKIFDYYTPKSGLWKFDQNATQLPIDPDNDEDFSDECVLDVDYDNCLDALESIMEQYPNMYLDFNFKSVPWKLSIKNLPTKVEAEGRLSRNVKSATVTRDDSELFTRVYMVGYEKNKDANGVGCYTSKLSKKYGIIETVITGANDTAEIAERTVKNYLHKHKKPKYNIQINAIDLAEVTGEKLDKFTIGKLFRLALPDYNETVQEHITGLSFQAIYSNPNAVTVTLSDEADKVIKYIKDANKKASSVGKKAVTKVKKEGNTLTLIQGDGTTLNFSKAVTMKGEWKGGRYTVKAYHKPDENSPELGDYLGQISTKLNDIVLQANKDASRYNTYWLSIPLKVMYDSGKIGTSQGYGNTEYTQDFKISAKIVWDAVTVNPPTCRQSAVPSGDTRTAIPIKATAANGNSNEATFTLTRTTYTVSGQSNYCVNLLEGSTIIGRIGVQSVYQDGWNAVTVNAPTGKDSAVPSTGTRTDVVIKATAANGNSNEATFTLSRTTYNSGNYCVNLLEGSKIIGRISVQDVYNAVTVNAPTCAQSAVGSGSTRSAIRIKATASNSASNEATFNLTRDTYGSDSNHCVNLLEGSTVIGRIGTQTVYNEGKTDGGVITSLSAPSTSGGTSTKNPFTVTATSAGGGSSSVNYYISFATVGTVKYAEIRQGSSSGTLVGRATVI